MAERLPGVLDCYKVACHWCDRTRWFFPACDTAARARVLAKAGGWRETSRGWECSSCTESRARTRRRMKSNVQVTLPGFGKLGK